MVQKGTHSLLLEMPYWIQTGIIFDYSNDVIYATVIFNNVKYKVKFKTLTPKNMKD
jgi:hypothetical protein